MARLISKQRFSAPISFLARANFRILLRYQRRLARMLRHHSYWVGRGLVLPAARDGMSQRSPDVVKGTDQTFPTHRKSIPYRHLKHAICHSSCPGIWNGRRESNLRP